MRPSKNKKEKRQRERERETGRFIFFKIFFQVLSLATALLYLRRRFHFFITNESFPPSRWCLTHALDAVSICCFAIRAWFRGWLGLVNPLCCCGASCAGLGLGRFLVALLSVCEVQFVQVWPDQLVYMLKMDKLWIRSCFI